ncbi:hypothetical protein [Aliidiomarina sanyensis]|uniref:Uncharacterized protein n=1 Tax=Aliidiomarina sanyensis TaxID=1249555 RepID=A0A432WAX2_9GAMM|nr:hypothetical protein [Aliidiomarina sanyensis]RUO27972.1 hypothetical protein CWE11_11080 [Aliidiomarina sanyensis]
MSNKVAAGLVIGLLSGGLFSMPLHAVQNSLDVAARKSNMVAHVILTSSEMIEIRENGDFIGSCGIVYESRVVELLSHGEEVGEYLSFYGKQPLKTGRNYLVFLGNSDVNQANQINDELCRDIFASQPFVMASFEMKREGEGSRLHKIDRFVLVYEDMRLELPEKVKTWKREHKLCNIKMSDVEECEVYKTETLIDWNEIKTYLKQRM